MQALMKKHRTETETIELRFLGPKKNRKQAVRTLGSMGFVDISDAVSMARVFSLHRRAVARRFSIRCKGKGRD